MGFYQLGCLTGQLDRSQTTSIYLCGSLITAGGAFAESAFKAQTLTPDPDNAGAGKQQFLMCAAVVYAALI